MVTIKGSRTDFSTISASPTKKAKLWGISCPAEVLPHKAPNWCKLALKTAVSWSRISNHGGGITVPARFASEEQKLDYPEKFPGDTFITSNQWFCFEINTLRSFQHLQCISNFSEWMNDQPQVSIKESWNDSNSLGVVLVPLFTSRAECIKSLEISPYVSLRWRGICFFSFNRYTSLTTRRVYSIYKSIPAKSTLASDVCRTPASAIGKIIL